MAFFTAGYMIIWLLVLFYTLFIQGRQRKLEQELVLLEELVVERNKTAG